jgi:hypothetical protein
MKNTMVGVDGDADEPRSCDVGRGLGATTETKYVLTRTGKMRKKEAVLNSVWLIRKTQINKYENDYNKFMFNSLGNSYIKTSYIMVIIHIK